MWDWYLCVCVCVCVCVFIFREGILATLSYSGVLQPIRFRAKKLGYLKPLPGYLPYISVLYQKRQQALQARGVHIGADSKPTPTQTTHTLTHSHNHTHIDGYIYVCVSVSIVGFLIGP